MSNASRGTMLSMLLKTLLLAGLSSIRSCILIEGASTTMGDHFIFQLPFLQEANGHAVVSMVTSWNKPFRVTMTIPHVKGVINKEFMLYRLEAVSVDLRNMYKLACSLKQQSVLHVVIRSSPNNMFAVFLTVMDSFLSIETFPAVPLAGFSDHYYIVTFDYNPMFVVIHYITKNNPSLYFYTDYDFQYLSCVVLPWYPTQMFAYMSGESVIYESCLRTTYKLKSPDNPPFFECNETRFTVPDLSYSGMEVKTNREGQNVSAYFGVIAGNTRTFIHKNTCRKDSLDDDAMMAAFEPLLPRSWFGTEYILPHIQFKAGKRVIRVATMTDVYLGHNEARVNITTGKRTTEVTIPPHQVHLATDLPEGHHFLKSSQPVQCHYVVQHSCENPGSLAYSLLVPMDKGYYHYVWTSPDNLDFHPLNSILIIVKRTAKNSLLMDDVSFSYTTETQVGGRPEYDVVALSVSPGAHDLYSLTHTPYLCYLYGEEVQRLYLHPAGYTIAIKNENCVPDPKGQGLLELVDDDCDGRLDEELKDGIDNDKDGLIDEDLQRPVRVNGEWSAWSEWACPLYCGQPIKMNLQRTKTCTNPKPTIDARYCLGEENETKMENCIPNKNCALVPGQWGSWSSWSCPDYCGRISAPKYEEQSRICNVKETVNSSLPPCPGFSHRKRSKDCASYFITCSIDCPDWTYGYNCSQTCPKCLDHCDKVTGFCRRCHTGFYQRTNSCNTECPPYTWGNLCLGHCPAKCQADCINRTTGECPPPPPDYTMIVVFCTWPLTILPMICLAYLIIRLHRRLLNELEEGY